MWSRLKKDLDNAVVLTESAFFLKNILRIDDAPLPLALQNVIEEFYNKQEKRWIIFPRDSQEHTFYRPFICLANKINDNVGNERVQGQWIDCHSEKPAANTESLAAIRPDCAFVTNSEEVLIARQRYEDVIKELEKMENKEIRTELESQKEEAEKNFKVWWSQFIVVVEAKKEKSNDQKSQYIGALPQLSCYIRQMFRQQLDRRFALGITISAKSIAVWLFDRSGALGMSAVCDIHKEPERFIRIISAISNLPSHRLGWDPTMRLYNEYAKRFMFSYENCYTTLRPPPQISASKWSLTMVDDRKDQRKSFKFILDGPPLLARTSEVMNGRAVQVHRGYRENEEHKRARRPLVVKMSWQPAAKVEGHESFEAHFYEAIPRFRNRAIAASVIKANHGFDNEHSDNSPISTMNYIRGGAQTHGANTAEQLNQSIDKSGTRPDDLDERKESMAFMAFGQPTRSKHHIYFAGEDSKLTDRIQTRIALDVWGWPIKYFASLEELVNIIRDVIDDHEGMVNANVLHRDISDGNIIIQPEFPRQGEDVDVDVSVLKTSGRLIDLDHSKKGTSTMVQKRTYSDGDALTVQLLKDQYNVEETAAKQAISLTVLEDVFAYCSQAINLNVLDAKPNGYWTAADFGWDLNVASIPDFTSHISNVYKRTGTIPFMSHRIVGRAGAMPDIHSAIHDMESLWWVVVHICLIRESGGGRRRTDINEGCQELINQLFYADVNTIALAKARFFSRSEHEAINHLFKQFHPYFDPIKSMLKHWRDALVLGYTFEAFEFYHIHRYIRAIVNRTLAFLKIEDSELPTIREEMMRRAKEYRSICNIPLESIPSVPTSPKIPPAKKPRIS